MRKAVNEIIKESRRLVRQGRKEIELARRTVEEAQAIADQAEETVQLIREQKKLREKKVKGSISCPLPFEVRLDPKLVTQIESERRCYAPRF